MELPRESNKMKRSNPVSLQTLASKSSKLDLANLESHDPENEEANPLESFENDIEQEMQKYCQSFVLQKPERTIRKLSMLTFDEATRANLTKGSLESCKMYFCGRLLSEYQKLLSDAQRELFEKTWLPIFALGLTEIGAAKLKDLINMYSKSCNDYMEMAFNKEDSDNYKEVEHCIPRDIFDLLLDKVSEKKGVKQEQELSWLVYWCKFHSCTHDDAMSVVIDACQVRTEKETSAKQKVIVDEPVSLYLSLKRPMYINIKTEVTNMGPNVAVDNEAGTLLSKLIRASLPALEQDVPVQFCNYKKYEGVDHTGQSITIDAGNKFQSAVVAVSNIKLSKKINSGQIQAKLFGTFSSSSTNFIKCKSG